MTLILWSMQNPAYPGSERTIQCLCADHPLRRTCWSSASLVGGSLSTVRFFWQKSSLLDSDSLTQLKCLRFVVEDNSQSFELPEMFVIEMQQLEGITSQIHKLLASWIIQPWKSERQTAPSCSLSHAGRPSSCLAVWSLPILSCAHTFSEFSRTDSFKLSCRYRTASTNHIWIA